MIKKWDNHFSGENSHGLKAEQILLALAHIATDLCLSWPKVLNLVTVRGLMKTLV